MGPRLPSKRLCLLALLFSYANLAMANLLAEGEDFTNNLVSDLAPLLALFGESVTTQFMSQATGWADCIMLAMAPLGIITIIVSAIRVGGYRWLKAVIGRARENIVAAELEVMSSTSKEACELWNGRTVVKCQGSAEVCEFICIYPVESVLKKGAIKKVRIMDVEAAKSREIGKAGSTSVKGTISESDSASSQTSSLKDGDFGYLRVREKKKIIVLKALRCWAEWLRKPRVNIKLLMLWKNFVVPKVRSAGSALASNSPSNAEKGEVTSKASGGEEDSNPPPSQNTPGQDPAQHINSEQSRDDKIVIVHNRKHQAPNISLNCRSDEGEWHQWLCAIFGIVLQAGVLVYFGFVTRYHTMQFDKDGEPVENYAMPLAITGTILLASGILICGHVIESSSREEVLEVPDRTISAVAMVWLQKQRTVSDQHFNSVAIYPDMRRYRAYTSERAIGEDHDQVTVRKNDMTTPAVTGTSTRDEELTGQAATQSLKLLTASGTFISLMGIVGQFTGLRGMHWTASIAQLGAIVVMTGLRAMVRRHLAHGIKHKNLSPGFELDWFVMSLADLGSAPWIPNRKETKPTPLDTQQTSTQGPQEDNNDDQGDCDRRSQPRSWTIHTGIRTPDPSHAAMTDSQWHSRTGRQVGQPFREVSEPSRAQSILSLRRHLGELGNWQSPVLPESLALVGAIERTMNFFAPRLKDEVKGSDYFCWKLKARTNFEPNAGLEDISFHLKRTADGWVAFLDELDAALSLWLASVKDAKFEKPASEFPSADDSWIRGKQKQQDRCIQILGPSTIRLLADLAVWMPKGLDGIWGEVQPDAGPGEEYDEISSHEEDHGDRIPEIIPVERIGWSGHQYEMDDFEVAGFINQPNPANKEDCKVSWKHMKTTSFDDKAGTQTTQWKWRPAKEIRKIRQNKKSRKIRRTESMDVRRPRIWCTLLVESQDSFKGLYSKDLFSNFMWALVSELKAYSRLKSRRAIGQGGKGTISVWDNSALEREDVARLVQNITELGFWTEEERSKAAAEGDPEESKTRKMCAIWCHPSLTMNKLAGIDGEAHRHPDVGQIAEEFVAQAVQGPTIVYASGPGTMISKLRTAVASLNSGRRVWNGDERWDVDLREDNRLEY